MKNPKSPNAERTAICECIAQALAKQRTKRRIVITDKTRRAIKAAVTAYGFTAAPMAERSKRDQGRHYRAVKDAAGALRKALLELDLLERARLRIGYEEVWGSALPTDRLEALEASAAKALADLERQTRPLTRKEQARALGLSARAYSALSAEEKTAVDAFFNVRPRRGRKRENDALRDFIRAMKGLHEWASTTGYDSVNDEYCGELHLALRAVLPCVGVKKMTSENLHKIITQAVPTKKKSL